MVSVTLVTGENLVGRFLNASSDAITLSGRDTPWVVAAETVARVRIRQRRTGAGALIGALVLGGVGVATATGRDGSPGAAVGVAWGGAIWGALIGASIPRYTLVYER
jgi:hypothetical protein